jgi:4-amino-4-deoxy-L-arabinose transferase-like glycosyltransferase
MPRKHVKGRSVRADESARADRRSPPLQTSNPENEFLSFLLPEKGPLERWIAFGVFAVSLLYLSFFRRYTSMDPDEGIILQGAQRILQGQVLYRDFFSYFTPGSYYFLALIFKFFGSSLVVARTALAVYGGLFSVFTYLMARRVCSRGFALFSSYLVTLTCLPWRFLEIHNWDSTLWACAAVYCGIRFLESRGAGWILAVGSFASLTFLFEQSKGAGLALGTGLGFAIILKLNPAPGHLARRHWVTLAVGFLWPFVLTLSFFAAQHALSIMISDWFWPFWHYSGVNRVPYGFQRWAGILSQGDLRPGAWFGKVVAILAMGSSLLLPALPIVGMMLGVYWILKAKSLRLEPVKAAYYIFTCSAIAGLFLSVVIARADALHFVYLIPLLYLVLAWIMDGRDLLGNRESSFWSLVNIVIFLAFTTTGAAFLSANHRADITLKTRRGTLRVARQDSVVNFTQANVPAGSKILVYPYLPLYYYLTATFSPARFDYLQPGMHTRAQEEEAIREISANRTPVVLWEFGFSEKIPNSWPNTPLRYMLDAPIADYITSEYHSCRVLTSAAGWRFLYMVRNGLQCPSASAKSPG